MVKRLETPEGLSPSKTEDILDGFRHCITAQVFDAMEMIGLPNAERGVATGLIALSPELPTMVGIASTIMEGPPRVGGQGRSFGHGDLMRSMKPNGVLVIAAGGSNGVSYWGSMFNMEASRRGLVGVVVDGALRDVRGIREAGMPVFCTGSNPLGSRGRVETLTVNEPVVCAGVQVHPGDFVVGDADSVVFIPPEHAEEVMKLALKKAQEEEIKERNLRNVPIEFLKQAHEDPNLKL